MADFFALLRLGPGAPEVRHLQLDRAIQEELSASFRVAAQKLRGDLDLVPFGDQVFKPDETEAWVVEPFQLPEHVAVALDNPLGCPSLAGNVTEAEVKGIVGQFEDFTAFQALDRRRVLTHERLNIIWSGDTYRRLENPVLQIGNDVHAILEGEQLIFRNDWWTRRLFDLADAYREATDEDVRRFVGRPDVAAEDGEGLLAGATQWERKRIGMILQGELLDHCGPAMIRERAAEYGIQVRTDHNEGPERLVIPRDGRERRELLRFLEEDYYRGPLTDTTYLANSKRAVRRR